MSDETARRLAAWMEAEERPRLLATAEGRIIWMNPAAASLPVAAFPFAARGAAAAAAGRRLDPRLLAAARAGESLACASAGPGFRTEAWSVWTRPLPGPGAPVIGVALQARQPTPELGALARSWGLTPAELRVVQLVSQGLETPAIARALAISVQTLRTHLKHVYRKLGVTSRGGLFAALADLQRP